MRPVLAAFLVSLGSGTVSLAQTEVLENQGLRLELTAPDASLKIIDKATKVVWTVGPPRVVLADGTMQPVRPMEGVNRTQNTLTYKSGSGSFRLRLLQDPAAVQYSFTGEFRPQAGPRIKEVRLFQDSLAIGPGEGNYFAVPHRLGILLRAEDEQPARQRLGYSSGCSMAMMGAVQEGSALLLSWDTPEATLLISLDDRPIATSGQVRFFRGFGDRQIRWKGKTIEVDEERIVSVAKP